MINSIINLFNKLFVSTVFAVTPPNNDNKLINPVIGNLGNNPEQAASGELFTQYAVSLWRTGISIGALFVVLYYIIAAYQWLSSGDDSQGVDKAKARFTNATIGLILLVASFAIVAFVGSLLFGEEFDILSITFPTI